jgi:hypothetical protein
LLSSLVEKSLVGVEALEGEAHYQLGDLSGACNWLSGLAWVAVVSVRAGRQPPLPLATAARLEGAAEALSTDLVAAPAGEAEPQVRAALRSLLGDATFTAAQAEGRAMSLAQALACALREAGGMVEPPRASRPVAAQDEPRVLA